MKEKIEKLKTFLAGTTTISNREFVLAMAVGILGGIVFGLLTSPRKNTTIGSNNGNNSPCGNGLKAGKKAGDWDVTIFLIIIFYSIIIKKYTAVL